MRAYGKKRFIICKCCNARWAFHKGSRKRARREGKKLARIPSSSFR